MQFLPTADIYYPPGQKYLMHNFYVIGHRGVAGEKFENSMSGFKHALTLDLDAVELDIRQHAGELWVIHDQELDRLTDASGKFHQLDDPSTLRLKNAGIDGIFTDYPTKLLDLR
jgi:glycerophosphoryl diester phosphodiesterase